MPCVVALLLPLVSYQSRTLAGTLQDSSLFRSTEIGSDQTRSERMESWAEKRPSDTVWVGQEIVHTSHSVGRQATPPAQNHNATVGH